MEKFLVRLEKVVDISKFVEVMNSIPYEATLVHGRYRVDARSLMGIFGMNLSDVLTLEIDIPEDTNEEAMEKYKAGIEKVKYLLIVVDKTDRAAWYEDMLASIKEVIEKGKEDNDNGEFKLFVTDLRKLLENI